MFMSFGCWYSGDILILGFVGYSDGDDAYFYEYTHKMGFLEYLGWRYETWVGRLAGEAMVYIAFHLGLPFWRLVNALMLTLLPLGILSLAVTAERVPQGTFQDWSVGSRHVWERIAAEGRPDFRGDRCGVRLFFDGCADGRLCGCVGQRLHLLYMVVYLRDMGAHHICGICVCRETGERSRRRSMGHSYGGVLPLEVSLCDSLRGGRFYVD